jgi:hypothetical protein
MIKETVELYNGPTLLLRTDNTDPLPDGVLPNCTHMIVRTEMSKSEFFHRYALRGGGILIPKGMSTDDHQRVLKEIRRKIDLNVKYDIHSVTDSAFMKSARILDEYIT